MGFVRRFVSIVSLAMLLCSCLRIEGSQPKTEAPQLNSLSVNDIEKVFDVASIHPSRSEGEEESGITSDGFKAKNTTLYVVIMQAFYPRPASFWRLRELAAPTWVFSEQFDIDARIDPSLIEKFQHMSEVEKERFIRPMLQNMLIDRCSLREQVISKTFEAIALVPVSHGLHDVRTSNAHGTSQNGGIAIADGGTMLPLYEEQRGRSIRFTHTSISVLAEVLSGLLASTDSTVENESGVEGYFDFTLPKRAGDTTAETGQVEDNLSAWQIGAIGLKLKRVPITVPVISVTHVDRPNIN